MRMVLLVAVLSVAGIAQKLPGILGVALGSDGGEIVVRSVLPGSPARKAGLRPGDRVITVHREGEEDVAKTLPIRSAHEGRYRLYYIPPGKLARVVVQRGDKKLSMKVRMADFASMKKLAQWKKRVPAGRPSPGFWAERWDLPEGMLEPPSPENTGGKVVVLFLYQARCGACTVRGFPVHVATEKSFATSDKVVFVNVHAVAEGHRANTFEAGVSVARRLGSKAPVLEDTKIDGLSASELWRNYGATWSPWTIVIGRKGAIVYNGDTPTKQDLGKIIRKAMGQRR